MTTSRLGATTRGIWTRRQALAVVSPGQLRGHLAAGEWQRLWPGVYTDGGIVPDAEQRAFAAVLAGGGQDQPSPSATGRVRLRAIACGRTAARVYGFVLIDDDDPVTGADQHRLDEVSGWTHARDVGQPAGFDDRSGPRPGRVLRRRELVLGAGDLVRAPSGLWLTSPARTVVECAQLLSTEALVCLLDDALRRRLLRPEDLSRSSARRYGDRGVGKLRTAVAVADSRAESPIESLARLLLLPRLPGLRPQLTVTDRSGRPVARFDLADPDIRLAVELDGRRAHAGEVMRAKDSRRDRRTAALGWVTERATWWDVRRGQSGFVDRIAHRAAELGRHAA